MAPFPKPLSKELLAAYGIPVTQPVAAATPEEAVRAAGEVGYPVVLKIHSPDITHKTDVGGVALDLADAEAVRAAFRTMIGYRRRQSPRSPPRRRHRPKDDPGARTGSR